MSNQAEQPKRSQSQSQNPVWDLDRLDPALRKAELYRLSAFVEELTAKDIEVPRCWYVHGWIRDRLGAFLAWRGEITTGAEAARWQADLATCQQSRDWHDAIHHSVMHRSAAKAGDGAGTGTEVRLPAFADAVRELCSPSPLAAPAAASTSAFAFPQENGHGHE